RRSSASDQSPPLLSAGLLPRGGRTAAVRGVVVSNVPASGVPAGPALVRATELPVTQAEETVLVVNLRLWSEPHVAVDTDTLRDRRFARGVDQYGRFSFFVH